MANVLGQDVILSFTDDAFPFACARSINLSIENDMIETSNVGNGNFRTYIPGALKYSGTIEGLVVLYNGSISSYTIEQLQGLILTSQSFKMRWYEKDVTSQHYMVKDATIFLTNLTETASFDNAVTFSADFTGTGPITITYGNV